MSLYETIASLPLRIEGYALQGLARTVSSGFERKSTIFVLQRRRRGGPRRGRDLRAGGPRRPAAGRPGARARRASGRSTRSPSTSRRSTSSPASRPQQDVYRRYRRWGFESAALDLALRQADTSLHELLGRTPEPVTFVVSSRMGDPPTIAPVAAPPGGLPGAPLQARRDAGLARGADRRAAGDRRGRLDRLQGRLQGHARRHADRPGLLQAHRAVVPGRLARGPRPRDRRGAQRARRPPGPDHLGRADPLRRGHPGRARDAAHGQPQAVALRQR